MIPVGFGYGEQSMSDPFQPFVSRAPNGFAGGIGNPMQDAFQRFLSAQGQSAGGTPPIRPMSDPFKPLIQRAPSEQNLTPEQLAAMEKRRLEQNALDNLGPTQEELARNTALYGENGSQVVPNPFGIAGGVGTPPIRPMSDPFRRSDDRDDAAYQARRSQYEQFMATQGGQPLAGRLGPQQEDFTISDGKFFPRPQQPQVGRTSGGYNPNTGQFTPPVGGPLMPPPQPSGGRGFDFSFDPTQPRISGGPVGFAGGGTGMPPIGQPMTQPPMQPMTQPPMGGGLPYNNGFNNPGQPQQPMTQPAVGTPFNKPTGSQVQPPMTQPPAGGGTGTSPQPYNNGFYNPGQPPMAMKKGGFAVKAVWDKKRPKDLGEPKDLSVKRKKSAKARAKAAGRPYPNLIDNMAAARKKGK